MTVTEESNRLCSFQSQIISTGFISTRNPEPHPKTHTQHTHMHMPTHTHTCTHAHTGKHMELSCKALLQEMGRAVKIKSKSLRLQLQ
jgi:type IV secretory pathway VirD2 relaxase